MFILDTEADMCGESFTVHYHDVAVRVIAGRDNYAISKETMADLAGMNRDVFKDHLRRWHEFVDDHLRLRRTVDWDWFDTKNSIVLESIDELDGKALQQVTRIYYSGGIISSWMLFQIDFSRFLWKTDVYHFLIEILSDNMDLINKKYRNKSNNKQLETLFTENDAFK